MTCKQQDDNLQLIVFIINYQQSRCQMIIDRHQLAVVHHLKMLESIIEHGGGK